MALRARLLVRPPPPAARPAGRGARSRLQSRHRRDSARGRAAAPPMPSGWRPKRRGRSSGVTARVVLAGDTTVAVGRRILPPADSPERQRELLALLSGRRHHVLSAIAVIDAQGRLRHRTSDNVVIFKRLEAAEIDAYVASGEGAGQGGGLRHPGARRGPDPLDVGQPLRRHGPAAARNAHAAARRGGRCRLSGWWSAASARTGRR